jgi:uncharacterized protein (TIGR02145 family)
MKKVLLIFIGIALFIIKGQSQTVTDIDGNVYNTVTIGTQVWLKENLKTTHFNNGDSIPFVTYLHLWEFLTTPAYCNYFNDSNNVSTYGRLYNWNTVNDNRNMCPIGWHVPADTEWTILVNYLGGYSIAGGKMKEPDTIHWWSPNIGASNYSGFTGLPGGYINSHTGGMFVNKRLSGYFWSSTGCDTCGYWSRILFNFTPEIHRIGLQYTDGLSVRCLSDFPAKINEYGLNNNIIIAPNPFSQSTQITLNQSYHNIALAVYDIQGKQVAQQQYADCDKIQLNRNQLSNGLYFLKLTLDDKAVESGKIVISEK